MADFANQLYLRFLYPLKKIVTGASRMELHRRFWDELANRGGAPHLGNFSAYHERTIAWHWQVVSQHLGERPLRVMDVGAGAGSALNSYARAMQGRLQQGFGVDISAAIVNQAKQTYPQFHFATANIAGDQQLPFQEALGKIDLLYCNSVLHSIAQRELPQFLKNCAAYLAPGGVGLFSWWAPYYKDEEWIIAYLPNTHRHRESIVRQSLPVELKVVESAQLRTPILSQMEQRKVGWVRRLLSPLHPRQAGVLMVKHQ